MVMETPSPQCVGREFVRQYYTLLHEAPLHLHRFYSHNSSFVHGGVEKPGEELPPVMGQNDIHKKIISLNFRDCHAKIRQVDSQATVGSAVVVQVTGELSNNGQPMRRFMQTFVLAPQSPKKYYVHNDIFRYQDEVFHDSETDLETQEETIDSEPGDIETPSQPESVQDGPYFEQQSQVPLSNGNVHNEDRTDASSVKSLEEETKTEEEQPQKPVATFEAEIEEEKTPIVEPEEEPEEKPAEQKPFSWAALASKNTTNMGSAQTAPPVQQIKSAPVVNKTSELKQNETGGNAPQPQRAQRAPRDRGAGSNRERDGSRNARESDESGRRSRYPDSHQVFVGNLPHGILDCDLKEFFEGFGKVMELRINKKSGRDVPNFGFVVFEDEETVQKVLTSKPFQLKSGHRLNVEEKKQRGESGRPGSGTRSVGRGGNTGSQRGSLVMGNMGRGGARGANSTGSGSSRGGTAGGDRRGGLGGPRR